MAFQLQMTSSALKFAARPRAGAPNVGPLSRTPAVSMPALAGTAKSLSAPLVRRTQQRPQQATRLTVAASEGASFSEGLSGPNDFSPLLAVAAFVAVRLNKLHVDRVRLLQALAILQLFVTAVNLVSRRGIGDKVSTFVGPAVLAAAVLSIRHVTYMDAATGLFGYFLSENLETITGIPYYAFVATLAVALYLGYGTLWYVVAFAVAAAGKVYNSTKNNTALPTLVIPGIVAAAYAIWKEATFPLALCIYLAQTVWSGFGAVDSLSKRVQE